MKANKSAVRPLVSITAQNFWSNVTKRIHQEVYSAYPTEIIHWAKLLDLARKRKIRRPRVPGGAGTESARRVARLLTKGCKEVTP